MAPTADRRPPTVMSTCPEDAHKEALHIRTGRAELLSGRRFRPIWAAAVRHTFDRDRLCFVPFLTEDQDW